MRTEDNKQLCSFRNKGSIKIKLIYGDSHENFSKTYEFGSVISCIDENDFKMIRRIENEYSNLVKQIFR